MRKLYFGIMGTIFPRVLYREQTEAGSGANPAPGLHDPAPAPPSPSHHSAGPDVTPVPPPRYYLNFNKIIGVDCLFVS